MSIIPRLAAVEVTGPRFAAVFVAVPLSFFDLSVSSPRSASTESAVDQPRFNVYAFRKLPGDSNRDLRNRTARKDSSLRIK